jgi:hypothetical protein
MSNRPLVGQVPVQVNHAPVTSITNVQARRQRKNTVKQGAYGPIGTAKGQPAVTGSFDLAVFKIGEEIDIEALWNSEEGFTLTFQEGNRRYMCTGCQIDSDEISSAMEQGETNKKISFTATEKKKVN